MARKLQQILNVTSSSNILNQWQKSQLQNAQSQQEIKCLLKTWFSSNYKRKLEGQFCNANWDDVYCWPPTAAGTSVTRLCSEILHEAYPEHLVDLKGSVTRRCLENGSWEPEHKINYSKCSEAYESYFSETEEDDSLVSLVQHMLFVGSIFSLICLGISLAIFYHFRNLWCTRVAVHVHLMISLAFRFIFMFVIAEPFVLGHENTYLDVDILCESILVLFLYATVTSVGWMFVQGLYLNVTLMTNMISVNIRYEFGIYCLIGWGVPVVIMFGYIIAMISKKQERCWLGYGDMKEMWILLGPTMFEVVTNGLFLLNVLRILLKKIRNSNSQANVSQIRAAAKATAVLFPVLGINNLLLMYNPGGVCHKFFVTLNTFFGSTQGVFVAVVYCFIDKDVQIAIRSSMNRATVIRNFYHDRRRKEPCNGENSPSAIPMSTLTSLEETNKSLGTNMV